LIYVGSGVLEKELRNSAAAAKNIHFLPFQNQSMMPAVYRLGDIFALPSIGPGETWGLAINEAMASARAVIAGSKVGGARDLVRQGLNGWIFQSGDSDALARTLRMALERGKEKVQAMGQMSLEIVREWSIEESALRMSDAILQHV